MMHTRFPKKPWEIMKIHDFSLKIYQILWKINEKSWIFMISQGFLGNLVRISYNPPSCVRAYCQASALRFNAFFRQCPVVRYTRNGGTHSVYVRSAATS